jgi:hypothetical protein
MASVQEERIRSVMINACARRPTCGSSLVQTSLLGSSLALRSLECMRTEEALKESRCKEADEVCARTGRGQHHFWL